MFLKSLIDRSRFGVWRKKNIEKKIATSVRAVVAHKKDIENTAGYYLQKMKPPNGNDDDAPYKQKKNTRITPNYTVDRQECNVVALILPHSSFETDTDTLSVTVML